MGGHGMVRWISCSTWAALPPLDTVTCHDTASPQNFVLCSLPGPSQAERISLKRPKKPQGTPALGEPLEGQNPSYQMVIFTLYIFAIISNKVPAVAQQDLSHVESTGTQVGSLAWHNELRIWPCHSCGLGCSCASDLIPGLGTPYAMGQPKMKKKKKKLKE